MRNVRAAVGTKHSFTSPKLFFANGSRGSRSADHPLLSQPAPFRMGTERFHKLRLA